MPHEALPGTGEAGGYTGLQAGMCKVCVQNSCNLAARFAGVKEPWHPGQLLSLLCTLFDGVHHDVVKKLHHV